MLEVELSDDGEMRVHIPGSSRGKGHDVYIPMTLPGVRVLNRLLQQRKGNEDSRIGEPGAPSNHVIKMWLAQEKAKVPKGPPSPGRAMAAKLKKPDPFADLNLDLSDFDIKL